MEAYDFIRAHHYDKEKNENRYIAFCEKIKVVNPNDKDFKQKCIPIELVAPDSDCLKGEDKFFSLNAFYRPSRRSDDIRHLRALYVDLDCYTVGKTPVEVAEILEDAYFDKVLPEPNVITFTGRGLNCIWWIENAPKQALNLWKRVNRHFYEVLTEFGADSSCADDPARIFRVPGTINSKSGKRVQANVRHKNKYYLGALFDEYTPWQINTRPKQKTNIKRAKGNGFTLMTLNKARMCDLITLQRIRNQADVLDGYRERACFLYWYYALCITGDVHEAENMANEYNKGFKCPLEQSELKGIKHYVENKSIEWLNAYMAKQLYNNAFEQIEKVTNPSKGIQISNKKLIEWFSISEEEQTVMTTIISENEKKRRDRNRRKMEREKEGRLKRDVYIKQQRDKTDDKLFKLHELLEANPKIKKTEIAKQLGVSRQHLYRLLKQL